MRYYFKTSFKRKRKNFLIRRRKKKQKGKGLKNIWNKFNKVYRLG